MLMRLFVVALLLAFIAGLAIAQEVVRRRHERQRIREELEQLRRNFGTGRLSDSTGPKCSANGEMIDNEIPSWQQDSDDLL